jgi:single-strand DNA-binding protein
MASVNKVILVGNLGQDPTVRYTQGGEPIANFSLATSESWTDKAGQKQERTEWHRVEVFGKTAQVVRDYCAKGRQVYLEGSIRYDEWMDKDGNKRYMTKIRVSGPGSRLVMLGVAKHGDGDRRVSEPEPAEFQATDDDVPFVWLLPVLSPLLTLGALLT